MRDDDIDDGLEDLPVDTTSRRHRRPVMLGQLLGELDLQMPAIDWDAHEAKIAAARAAEAERNEQIRLSTRAQLLRNSGFSALAVESALGAGDAVPRIDTPAMRMARAFVGSRLTVLVLGGGTGAGKTTAAAWIALKSTSSAPALITADELEARGRYDKELRSWLRSRSLIVIDDLGAEAIDDKGYFRALVDGVIDRCYGDRRPLIITCNLRERARPGEEPQFVERYGERIWSRLHEVGSWADCGNDDLRRRLL